GGGASKPLKEGRMENGKARTALITGATDGVGRVVAKRLGQDGWRVLVHGRNRERGEALVKEIGQAGGRAAVFAADLASLAEVRRLADEVREATDRLHLLVNNAGIGTAGDTPGRQTSADGHELRFAVNYLAGFLLTELLLPLLKASAPSRIVNVSSAGQQAIDFPTSCSPSSTAASPPTARANWRRSCSPWTSPASSRARA